MTTLHQQTVSSLPEDEPCVEHYDRIQSLKLEIERILEINSVSLQQRLRNSQAQQSSIEEVFGLIAEEYREKQEQIATLGRLVRNVLGYAVHTIELLTQEIQEKTEVAAGYDIDLEQHRMELARTERLLNDYSNQLSECQYARSVLERELLEANEIRERYQTLYEETLSNSKEDYVLDSTDSEVMSSRRQTNESFSEQSERRQLEMMLLEHEMKQLKNELAYKDTIIGQKEAARLQLFDRLRCKIQYDVGESDKSQAIHNNFRLLQENFRFAISENQQLKRSIQQLEAQLEDAENRGKELPEEFPCGMEPTLVSALSRHSSKGVLGETRKTQFSIGNNEFARLNRSSSHFSIQSERTSNKLQQLAAGITLASQMKAFDTESNQALNKNQYRFCVATEHSQGDCDFPGIVSPRLFTLRIPEAPPAINGKSEQSEEIQPEDLLCPNCKLCQSRSAKPVVQKQQGWLTSGLNSAYEKLRSYVVTKRVKKHA